MILDTFRVGEDFAIALDAIEGEVSDIETVTAYLAKSTSKSSFKKDPSFTEIELVVSSRAATETHAAGWNLMLPAAQSAVLDPGLYGIDAKLVSFAGTIDITDTTAVIKVTESAMA